ncbi:MAG: ATP synthase F1 subunit delta [Candidatus Gastranaerophilaceae bacterium]
MVNIKNSRTAKKYAEALFETSETQGNTERVLTEISDVRKVFEENSELQRFLTNPIITANDKKDAVKQIFGNDFLEITINFLYLLADNSRFDIFEEIEKELNELEKEKNNLITVKAVSAIEIKDYLKEKLVNKLQTILSKRVEVEYSVNPSIIGGLILEVNGKTVDDSVETKLKNIKKQLT